MKFRTDIQALRGLAVLLVVLQHARADFIGAGFLGVDIFFVISGFLITGMVGRAVEQRRFGFAEFYFRRARRLLPAAYVTFALTTLGAFFLLDAVEWHDYTRQLAGAVTFTGNFVLLHQTGYFSGAAALKPLLHVWSLSVEEQYYLLLPAALVLLPRRLWFAGNGAVLVASFALCAIVSFSRPDAAFYLLPTRAWELAIGSFVALATLSPGWARNLVARLFVPALIVVVAIPVWPLPAPHFVNITCVCVATGVIILRRHDALQDRPIPNALAVVGDASYSLYLVHWPIFAFIDNVYAGDPSFGAPGPWVLGTGVVLALVLGFALHRYVERPMRHAQLHARGRWLAATLAASALLVSVPFALVARTATQHAAGPAIDYAWLRRDNLGFDKVCDGYQRLEYTFKCSNARHPATMVWGDSFAMHLVPGLAATVPGGIVQATKSACGPLPGLAQMYQEYTRAFAERCLSFNQSVVDYLGAHPEIHTVVLSSPFYEYFDPARRMLRIVDGRQVVEAADEAVALATLRDTIVRLRALGKRVVIVAPPPSTGFDYTHCLERKARNRTLFGKFIDCNMPRAQYLASKRQVLDFLTQVRQQANIDVVSFDAFLCNRTECMTTLDGTILYRDEGHLSHDGSVVLAKATHLGTRITQAAR